MKGVPPGTGIGAYDHEYWRQVGTGTFTAYYMAGNLINNTSFQVAHTVDMLYAHPIVFPRGGTLDRIGTYAVQVVGGPKHARVGIYTATSTINLYPNALVVDGGILTLSTGLQVNAINTTVQPNVLYWGVIVFEDMVDVSATTTGFREHHECPIGGVSNTFGVQSGIRVAQAYGVLPANYPAGASYNTNYVPSVFVRFSA